MKRRLLVARALLNQPKLLVLDEPTTGLDPQARHLVWHRLRALKAQGVTQVLLDPRIFSTGRRALRMFS